MVEKFAPDIFGHVRFNYCFNCHHGVEIDFSDCKFKNNSLFYGKLHPIQINFTRIECKIIGNFCYRVICF